MHAPASPWSPLVFLFLFLENHFSVISVQIHLDRLSLVLTAREKEIIKLSYYNKQPTKKGNNKFVCNIISAGNTHNLETHNSSSWQPHSHHSCYNIYVKMDIRLILWYLITWTFFRQSNKRHLVNILYIYIY